MESFFLPALVIGAMCSLVYLIYTQVPKYLLLISPQINTESEQQSLPVALSGKTENNFVNKLLNKYLGNIGSIT